MVVLGKHIAGEPEEVAEGGQVFKTDFSPPVKNEPPTPRMTSTQTTMASTQTDAELFYNEENDCYYIRVGEGRIARACGVCKHRQTECLCYAESRRKYEERMAEKQRRQREFRATLPRTFTYEEAVKLQEQELIPLKYAKSRDGHGPLLPVGAAGAYVFVDKDNRVCFRRLNPRKT